MGIREAKTAACDRCPEEATWEKQWETTGGNYARATRGPEGWAWMSVHPEPDGSAKWRGLLCPTCAEALDDFIHALKP